MANTASWTLSINDDSDQLEQLLSEIIDDSVAQSKVTAATLESEISSLQTKQQAWNEKLRKRREIETRLFERIRKREAELRKAQNAHMKARYKTRNFQRKLADAEDRQRRMRATLGQEKLFLDNFSDIYTEGSFKNRAFMVSAIKDQINTEFPVKFSHDRTQKRMELSWVTGDVFIKNRLAGGVWPFNFGSFSVSVHFRYAGGRRTVDIYIKGHVGNTIVDGEYSHPHVREDGTPCLGNVARMIIEHMANQDVAQVICTITDYLCHYNEEDPYRRLMQWGVRNDLDMRELESYRNYLKFDDGPKNQCGLSQSDCMVMHNTGSDGKCTARVAGAIAGGCETFLASLNRLKETIKNG